MSIFPRLNQRTKVILPIRTNLSEYNEIPEHTVISADTEIPSTLDGPTVVQRYRNLTINGGCTLTTQYRCCGLVLVVDGDLTISGSISMTARGANFIPNGDHLIKNTLLPANDIVYEIDIPATADEIADFLNKEKSRYHSLDELPAIYRPTLYAKGPSGNIYFPGDLGSVPIVGGAGAVRRSTEGAGSAGTAGTNRGCGGGGSGGAKKGTSGGGTAGTCYSGGSGGGGSADYGNAGTGSPYGGAGGDGLAAGGGAGNPGGTGSEAGETGTGGLLIIICTGKVTINASGSVKAWGSSGGYAFWGGGGGSGGGSINIFHSSFVNNGTLSASGGSGGGDGSTRGGAGGAGCVTIDQYNF